MKVRLQKAVALLMSITLLCGAMTSCSPSAPHGSSLTDTARDEHNKASVSAPIPLSGFEDITDGQGTCTYQMVAEFSDTYTVVCDDATIRVTTGGETTEGEATVRCEIEEGATVQIAVSGLPASQKVHVDVIPQENRQRLPYKANFTVDPTTLDTEGTKTSPAPTKIEYQKREGGTYVYLNNPEKLQPEDVGQAILRDEGLYGDVQVTWEHSNYTNQAIYLGYQLKNEGSGDVYVTVQNVGYQIQGEWLGQQSWSDYYNRKFELPGDYFTSSGAVAEKYVGQDFIDYTPRVFQPVTYRIPAGEYIYVVGGTSSDAFNHVNVAQTADQRVSPGRCTNAVAKMFITGGDVTGTFYCYTDTAQVQAEPEEQGYILMRGGTQFGLQYKGVDYHQALIESNPVFYVNDDTEPGSLSVAYDTYYDDRVYYGVKNKPYAAYKSEKDEYRGRRWKTNINPQSSTAVGVDMSTFECLTTDGKTVTIDTEHADGTGDPANIGNWMIDYHDNITLVNQGDRPRTFTINKNANGALMTYVADREGNVLATKCTIIPLEESSTSEQWELYEVTVPPHSTAQFTVSFLLMGNSYGGVSHWIEVI